MACTVFTIANQKGGVGKTTTAVNLAAALAERKIHTLVVDLDPQANATSALGVEKFEGKSLYRPLHGEGSAFEMLTPTQWPHLALIPSEVDLAAIEIELAQQPNYLMRLRTVLEPLRNSGGYRAIIIDCPPSLGLLTLNALVAADAVLVPLQCEFYALEGISGLMRTVESVRRRLNPKLRLQGVVLTMFDRRNNLSQAVAEDVRACLGASVFETIVPRNVRLSEAPSHGLPALIYDLRCPGPEAYVRLARELIGRLPQLAEAA